MFSDSLYGLKVIVVEDRADQVVDFHLPRTRARTSSVRKSYNRMRRRAAVVYKTVVTRFEDTCGGDCVMAGDRIYMSPRSVAALREQAAALPAPVQFKPAVPAPTISSALSSDELIKTMREVMKRCGAPRKPLFDHFPAHVPLTLPPKDLGQLRFRDRCDAFAAVYRPTTAFISCFS